MERGVRRRAALRALRRHGCCPGGGTPAMDSWSGTASTLVMLVLRIATPLLRAGAPGRTTSSLKPVGPRLFLVRIDKVRADSGWVHRQYDGVPTPGSNVAWWFAPGPIRSISWRALRKDKSSEPAWRYARAHCVFCSRKAPHRGTARTVDGSGGRIRSVSDAQVRLKRAAKMERRRALAATPEIGFWVEAGGPA
jgi:hypothetical protein